MSETDAIVTDALTEESLSQAPIFEADAWPDMSMDDWDVEIRSYWQGLGVTRDDDDMPTPEAGTTVTDTADLEVTPSATGTITATEEMTGTGTVPDTEELEMTPEATGTAEMDTTPTPSAEEGEGVDVQIPRSVRLSVLLDYPVRNLEGEEIGELEDLMINWQEGRVAYAVLMTFNPIDQTVVIDIEAEMLEAAPGFDQNNWPLSADPDWDVEIRNFWEEREREMELMLTPVDDATDGQAPGAVATPTPAP